MWHPVGAPNNLLIINAMLSLEKMAEVGEASERICRPAAVAAETSKSHSPKVDQITKHKKRIEGSIEMRLQAAVQRGLPPKSRRPS